MPKRHLILLFILLSQAAFCQYLDSLKELLSREPRHAERSEILLQIGTLLVRDKPDSAIIIAQQVLEEIRPDDVTPQHFKVYELLGRAYMNSDNYTEALSHYVKAYDLAEHLGNSEFQAGTYSNIAYIYYNQKKIPEALDYMEKALAIFTSSGDQRKIASMNNNIGVLYQELRDYPKSLEHYNKALAISASLKNENSVANINTNIGNVYMLQSAYEPAMKHFQNALTIYQQLNNQKGLATVWCNVSQLHMNHKEARAAINAAHHSISFSEEVGSLKDRRESYAVLYEAYRHLGNYPEALKAHEQYVIYKDSMFTAEKERILSEMEAKFENRLKAREISQLKTEKELQQKILYWSVAFSVVLALGLVLVFLTLSLRNKLLQRKNQELKAEQKIIQLEKEKLQLGLDYKNRQVVSHALLMAQKNEMLQELGDKVKKIMESYRSGDNQSDSVVELKSLMKSINSHLELSDDWEQIKLHFDEVAPRFFQTLLERYPGLTPHEQKLCAYTRMNMSTKEISRLLNIAPESVRMLRYRLRKKMMLPEEENIQELLQQL